MITLLLTWVGARIVTVTTVVVVAVAAVPTTLVVVSQEQTVSAQQHQQVVLVAAVKKAGDEAIASLQNAEATCTVQVTQTVANAHIAPGKIQSQLAKAKLQLHGSVAPFIAAIQKDEATFAHLPAVTTEEEQSELDQIKSIQITALGEGSTSGVVTVTCQTVVIEIKTIIEVVVIEEEFHVVSREGDD